MLAVGPAGCTGGGSMNELIKKTSRRIGSVKSFDGVCHKCNSPVCFREEFFVVEIENTDTLFCFVPIDTLLCPHCGVNMEAMTIYKTLDVTKELSKV
jgi:hypothetical protein